MSRFLVAAVSAAALFFSAQTANAQTYTSLTGSDARSILDSVGMNAESPEITSLGNVKIRFEDGDGNSTMFLSGCDSAKKCKRVRLVAGYSMEDKPSLSRINQWNREKNFSRAYIDSDGDPNIESDLDIEGGVQREALREFLRTYRISVRAFVKHIGFNR